MREISFSFFANFDSVPFFNFCFSLGCQVEVGESREFALIFFAGRKPTETGLLLPLVVKAKGEELEGGGGGRVGGPLWRYRESEKKIKKKYSSIVARR